jgi:hypothetical protein
MPKIFLTIVLFLALTSPIFAKKNRKPAGTIVSWKDVPAAIQTTVQSTAAGGKVKEVQKIPAPNGMVFYCVEVKGTDGKWEKVYVSDAGVLIKTEPDNARNNRKHKPLFGG